MSELNRVGDDLALGVTLDQLEAPVRVQCRANVEAFLGTEVPCATGGRFGVNEDQQPTGPSGVLLKSNGPWKNSHADIQGLSADCLSRLSMSSICGRKGPKGTGGRLSRHQPRWQGSDP